MISVQDADQGTVCCWVQIVQVMWNSTRWFVLSEGVGRSVAQISVGCLETKVEAGHCGTEMCPVWSAGRQPMQNLGRLMTSQQRAEGILFV